MQLHEDEQAVRLEPPGAATAAVIWLHGLGADGHDFVPVAEALALPAGAAVRFVFPHAPVRPVTINNGYAMRAWYDILSLSDRGRQDEAGIRDAERLVAGFIAAERAAGIPAARIVLAGFSQGGAIALHAGLRQSEPLAGILALSTYLPLAERLAAERHAASAAVPILMGHGSHDGVLPLALGETSRRALTALGHAIEWHVYPMQHQVCDEEIADIRRWLLRVLALAPER